MSSETTFTLEEIKQGCEPLWNNVECLTCSRLLAYVKVLLSCIEGRGVEDERLLPVAVHVLRWLYATMNPNGPIDKSLLRITQFEIHAELEQAVLKAQAAAFIRSKTKIAAPTEQDLRK